jgi:predicted Rossmann-fold nucleotide-binding protein
LGYHDKPIGVLNTAAYYDRLLEFLRASKSAEFMGEWQMSLVRTSDDAHGLLADLVQAAGMTKSSDLAQI